jgi:hypothetical protein
MLWQHASFVRLRKKTATPFLKSAGGKKLLAVDPDAMYIPSERGQTSSSSSSSSSSSNSAPTTTDTPRVAKKQKGRLLFNRRLTSILLQISNQVSFLFSFLLFLNSPNWKSKIESSLYWILDLSLAIFWHLALCVYFHQV